MLILPSSCKKDNTVSNPPVSTPNTWISLQALPEPIDIVGSFVINEKIYCLSTDWTAFSKPRTIYEYDPVLDTWTKKASMPDKRMGFAMVIINNKLYIIGGSTGPFSNYQHSVNEYNPVNDTWTLKTPMPTARGEVGVAVINDIIYIPEVILVHLISLPQLNHIIRLTIAGHL